jgi:hypothetical protein
MNFKILVVLAILLTLLGCDSEHVVISEPIASIPVEDAIPQIIIPTVTINVLVMYESADDVSDIMTEFRTANKVFYNSGAYVKFLGVGWIKYTDALGKNSLMEKSKHISSPEQLNLVRAWRDMYEADLAVLFVQGNFVLDYCGLAHSMTEDNGDPSKFLALVSVSCKRQNVLAHELGHLLGLRHSSQGSGIYGGIGHGYGNVEQNWFTIMGTSNEFSGSRLPRFSTPESRCLGYPCSDGIANSVAVINAIAPLVARYR